MTNGQSRQIYVSNGGHFENLGIYELVRRRCRYIVASDASEDSNLLFADLGSAIERIRTDFGIDIEIDLSPLRAHPETRRTAWHCAVGTIRYDKVDANARTGTLLYIKATLTGDEPTDVKRYAARHPSFPHESTADQWFDESQFESYRALGHHTARAVLQVVFSECRHVRRSCRPRPWPRTHRPPTRTTTRACARS